MARERDIQQEADRADNVNSATPAKKTGALPQGIQQVTGSDPRKYELPVPIAMWTKMWGLSVGLAAQSVKLTAQYFQSAVKAMGGMQEAWRKAYQRYFTTAEIEKWVEYDVAHHTKDDGTSPGGRYYIYVKNQMQAALDAMPPRWRAGMKNQLMNNPRMQQVMRSDEMAEQFESIDGIIHEVYMRKHPERAKTMRWQGTLCDEQYNNKFLTEKSREPGHRHGEITAIDADAIVKLFAKKNVTDYPHVLMTFSHAQGETLNDVMSITHGVEAMARDSEGTALPHGYIDKGVKPGTKRGEPGQTLTIYACDVEETPWKNGAALLRRVNELKRIAQTGEPDRQFNHISPGAKCVAKLIIKCMAEDPSQIDVSDPRSMSDIAAQAKKPITLRPDAVDIAHHFQLIGYSKGGNVASDVMRYLVAELTAKNAANQDVFAKHELSPTRNGDCSMSRHNVRNLVRSIAVMALASVEVGMSEHDKAYGVSRVAINNQHDLISAHHNYEDSTHDERWIIEGVEEHHGHAPHQFMGWRSLSEEFEARGYAHKDKRVARRLKEFYASNYGKAAIGHVLFNGHAAEGEVTIEAATGTTDAELMQYKDDINAAFRRAGLRGAKFENDKANPGIFNLSCHDPQTGEPVDFTKNVVALTKIKHAFEYLRRPEQKGLVIAQAIIDDEIQGQIHRAQAANAPGYWSRAVAPVHSASGRWVA